MSSVIRCRSVRAEVCARQLGGKSLESTGFCAGASESSRRAPTLAVPAGERLCVRKLCTNKCLIASPS